MDYYVASWLVKTQEASQYVLATKRTQRNKSFVVMSDSRDVRKQVPQKRDHRGLKSQCSLLSFSIMADSAINGDIFVWGLLA